MDISELAAAIDGSGVRFDYLLFDACFMSSVEALYDLRRAADYIVASPCEVMAHGFPYTTSTPAPRKLSTRRRCKATTEWKRTSSTIWKSTPWR